MFSPTTSKQFSDLIHEARVHGKRLNVCDDYGYLMLGVDEADVTLLQDGRADHAHVFTVHITYERTESENSWYRVNEDLRDADVLGWAETVGLAGTFEYFVGRYPVVLAA